MEIKYLGHSAFEITTIKDKEYKILIDPYLVMAGNYDFSNTDYIFVSHGHSDHLGCAVEISKKTGAKIVGIFELSNYCAKLGANTIPCSYGGWLNFPFAKVILVPAIHSSSNNEGQYLGSPCGFIFKFDEGKTLYFAGDTGLSAEIKVISELYKPEISILPVGGCYTMDIFHALIAAKWLDSEIVIPAHYNTFSQIKVEIEEFKRGVEKINKTPLILSINQKVKL